jgi:AcrR family transcriptional regulator
LPSPPSAVLRADAARNRERIIVAAASVFAERGLDASTAEIAQRAGVGEATLFRRFPSKDDLIDAIVETRMREVLALAEAAAEDPEPGPAFERLIRDLILIFTRDRGFFEAAGKQCITDPRFAPLREASLETFGRVLRRAQEAGTVRSDLSASDLTFLVRAAAYATDVPVPGLRSDLWQRYLRVVLDGMRPEGASRLRPGAPKL